MMLSRGTQKPDDKGIRGAASYTPSLPVAIIWSAVPGDMWARKPAHFLPTSTIQFARLKTGEGRILRLSDSNYESFAEILGLLKYGERGGIDQDEAVKILQYMHNRIIGRARGGEFRYIVLDEDGRPEDEGALPLSFTNPMTLIGELKDAFEWDDRHFLVSHANRLTADTYIFADAPAVQRAAVKLGYEAISYPDLFVGGESAAKQLLDMEIEDLQGIQMQRDIDSDEVPTHETIRPLTKGAVEPIKAVRTLDLLKEIDKAQLREG